MLVLKTVLDNVQYAGRIMSSQSHWKMDKNNKLEGHSVKRKYLYRRR